MPIAPSELGFAHLTNGFRENSDSVLFAIAVMVFVCGSCLLAMGLRLHLSLRLRTQRNLVLRDRRLLWCGILTRRCLGDCLILYSRGTMYWVREH
jgi:hypothetical protein